MNRLGNSRNGDNEPIVLDPPTFSPPENMRAAYLQRRKDEMDMLTDHARAEEWKPVVAVANHVRGSGAMYGFKNIGDAAENLVKAVQNGDANSFAFFAAYAKTVNETTC